MRKSRAFIKALERALATNEASPNGQTHQEKVDRLTALQKANENKQTSDATQADTQMFERRIDATDAIYARGLGILLD